MDVGGMVASVPGVLAVASGVFTLVNGFLAYRQCREQRQLQIERLKADADRNSLAWGQDAIATLAEAESAVREGAADPESEPFRARRAELSWRLSALADQGRMFFPNFDPKEHGQTKEEAYRGQRAPILYSLVYAFYEIEALRHATDRSPEDCAAFLFQCRRHLVSELQARLDPRQKNELVDRWDHLGSKQREDAIVGAGKLGVRMEARRRGTLGRYRDSGLLHRVDPSERLKIVRECDPGSDKDVA